MENNLHEIQAGEKSHRKKLNKLPMLLLGDKPEGGDVWIESNMRFRPVYMLGEPGTGKSSLMHRMALKDIKKGKGVIVVDPHGDLVKNIICTMPEERINDVTYFSIDSPICYNVLQAQTENKDKLIGEFVELLDKIHPNQPLTARMRRWLRKCLKVIVQKPDVTLKDIEKFFMVKEYRADLLEDIKSRDEELLACWKSGGIYDKAMKKDLGVTIDGLLDRVEELIMDERVKKITCYQNQLDFNEIVSGKVFLVDLSMIEGNLQNFIGSLIVHGVKTILIGKPMEERRPLALYVDEFQNFITSDFKHILPQCRKFLISICLGHQNHTQIPYDLLGTVIANSTTKIIFRCGDYKEANRMAGSFMNFTKEDFLGLPNYHAICRIVTEDGVEESRIETLPVPKRVREFEELFKEEDMPLQEQTPVIKDEIGWGWMHCDNKIKDSVEEIPT